MPRSISDLGDRHCDVARRPDAYLCFPDVCRAADKTLVCVYRDSDAHVATRQSIETALSRDNGLTWTSGPTLDPECGHCPRISMLPGGDLAVIDQSPSTLHTSRDNGATWEALRIPSLGHYIHDRVLALPDGSFMTTGHVHRGSAPQPTIRQGPSEQMAYRAKDRTWSWDALSVVAYEKHLVLCEGSIIHLGGDDLAVLLRENSFVGEPMYLCLSRDAGRTWSDPAPTPLVGHRPTLGMVSDGRLLVTYRNTGPSGGTSAWLGTLDELDSDFKVHGLHPDPDNPRFEDAGMVVETRRGLASDGDGVLYSLRPISDPSTARAWLEAKVRAVRSTSGSCGLRLGLWWRIFPDRIRCESPEVEDVPIAPGRAHTIRLDYAPGRVALTVDGVRRAVAEVNPQAAATRPVMFGNAPGTRSCKGKSVWFHVGQSIREERYLRHYKWRWDAGQGPPDAWVESRVLELAASGRTSWADYGYSGWTETGPGRFVCVYHHADAREPDYDPGRTSWVRATRFSISDFE